ncbi:FAD dependent oxidoreductase [Lasiosphaeris hirsuta]|uniref:FAD dependent oxidoreductase n=1 Tax=Lasiosphaeris hirsuta TaxID=260670 RepID=A0AA40BDF4_9PEZI|nr:FAD dependent oxidoreductase [Lasiosphaeris hirsuta]
MAPSPQQQQPQQPSILLIGAGTFGLSTALHLSSLPSPSHITLLDASPTIPSPLSAGHDLTKIVRAEYEDAFYADLALAAMARWAADPLLAPHYRPVGYLLGNSAAAGAKSRRSLERSLRSIEARAPWQGRIVAVEGGDAVRRVAPGLDGPMDGWSGYFNPVAGYVRAKELLGAVWEVVKGLPGVEVKPGEKVVRLEYEGDRCVGAVTEAGARYVADVVVLTVGASVGRLLPSIGRQVAARSWSVAHVQLTEEEASRLKGIPVTYSRDLGYFFEPDPDTRLLKVCPSGAGFTNYVKETGISVPREDNDFLPAGQEEAVRKILREHLPGLADRPLVDCKICWCADTADSEYIIDFVPGTKGLVVVSGDSGHAFKMFPLVGGWVKDLLDAGEQSIARWRWKEGASAGGEVSWRVGTTRDLNEATELAT